jgi:hypothetical protein
VPIPVPIALTVVSREHPLPKALPQRSRWRQSDYDVGANRGDVDDLAVAAGALVGQDGGVGARVRN